MRSVAVGAALATAAIATLTAAPFELPRPTGPHPVGTTTWRLTDNVRRESFKNGAELRQVEVLAWYPTSSTSGYAAAPYLREGLTEARTFATALRSPESVFDELADVRTHAFVGAPPLTAGHKLPLLVFSHGYANGVASSYTALVEELASHGYAVFSVVHPYESAAATLTDGRVVTSLDSAGKSLQGVVDVFTEWRQEDETMAAVTRTSDEAEQLRLLRAYLATLRHTDAALRRWVADTKLVLDRLSTLPAKSAAGLLAARVDVRRVGVFGHSMGGVAAGQFCVEDRRCAAGLNLDGIPQYGTMIDKAMARPFLMVYSARPGRTGASDAIYRRSAHPYYRVDVADTRHLDFGDMAFWGGPLQQIPVLGTLAPGRASEITRAIVRQYFDQELLGRRSMLLAGTAGFAETTVKTFRMPAR
jgi:hypothetical protein